jgi:hypothetical protein
LITNPPQSWRIEASEELRRYQARRMPAGRLDHELSRLRRVPPELLQEVQPEPGVRRLPIEIPKLRERTARSDMAGGPFAAGLVLPQVASSSWTTARREAPVR